MHNPCTQQDPRKTACSLRRPTGASLTPGTSFRALEYSIASCLQSAKKTRAGCVWWFSNSSTRKRNRRSDLSLYVLNTCRNGPLPLTIGSARKCEEATVRTPDECHINHLHGRLNTGVSCVSHVVTVQGARCKPHRWAGPFGFACALALHFFWFLAPAVPHAEVLYRATLSGREKNEFLKSHMTQPLLYRITVCRATPYQVGCRFGNITESC